MQGTAAAFVEILQDINPFIDTLFRGAAQYRCAHPKLTLRRYLSCSPPYVQAHVQALTPSSISNEKLSWPQPHTQVTQHARLPEQLAPQTPRHSHRSQTDHNEQI